MAGGIRNKGLPAKRGFSIAPQSRQINFKQLEETHGGDVAGAVRIMQSKALDQNKLPVVSKKIIALCSKTRAKTNSSNKAVKGDSVKSGSGNKLYQPDLFGDSLRPLPTPRFHSKKVYWVLDGHVFIKTVSNNRVTQSKILSNENGRYIIADGGLKYLLTAGNELKKI